jgi:hypothetical protein
MLDVLLFALPFLAVALVGLYLLIGSTYRVPRAAAHLGAQTEPDMIGAHARGVPQDDRRGPSYISRGSRALSLLGVALVGLSLFMLFQNVRVSGSFLRHLGLGSSGFGWSLLPLLFGLGWMIVRPRHLGGWTLAVVGVAIIVLEILGSLRFYFLPVSLVTVLLMLIPGAVGLALLAKYGGD